MPVLGKKMTYQMIYTVLILEYHVKIGNSILTAVIMYTLFESGIVNYAFV